MSDDILRFDGQEAVQLPLGIQMSESDSNSNSNSGISISEWEYDENIGGYNKYPKKKSEVKCECGVDTLGYGLHSTWCIKSPDYKEKSE